MTAFCPTCWKELPPGRDDCPICGQHVTQGPYTGKWRPMNKYWHMQLGLKLVVLAFMFLAIAILYLFLP